MSTNGSGEHCLAPPAGPAAVHHAAHPDVVADGHLGDLAAHLGDHSGQLVARNTGVAGPP